MPQYNGQIGRQNSSIPRNTGPHNRGGFIPTRSKWKPGLSVGRNTTQEGIDERSQAIINSTLRILDDDEFKGPEGFLRYQETEAFAKNASALGYEPEEFVQLLTAEMAQRAETHNESDIAKPPLA